MNRVLRAAALSVSLLLGATACGGSSADPLLPPTIPAVVDVGLVAANAFTTIEVEVTNPNLAPGTVEGLAASGVLSIPNGQVPLFVPGQATVTFQVRILPGGAVPFSDVINGTYGASDGSLTTFAISVIGQGEAVTVNTSPGALDFGDVLPGTSADRVVTLRNDSGMSSTTITGATMPTPEYGVVSPAFPFVIAAGATQDVTLRYTGGPPGVLAGDVAFASDVGAGAHTVAVTATTGGEEIIDLGTQTFSAGGVSSTAASIGASGITNELTFDVAADAIGFMIEATSAAGTDCGLGLLTGPNGEEFENENLSGPYIWLNDRPFTAPVPNTDRTEVQLAAGGGTYKVKILRFGNAATCDVRVIVERRPAANTDKIGVIDLNVYLANGLSVTAATAPSDSFIQGVLSTVNDILAVKGIRIGDKTYYDVTDSAYDSVTTSEFGPMLETTSAAADVRLNLFFVQAALPDQSSSILGVAATLGGPKSNGTPLSGVMSEVGGTSSFIGLVAAHEICHYLGLAHTRESTGSWDDVNDTTNYTSGNGGYLMHWQASGGTNITDGQALIILAHPHVGPALATPPPFQAKPRVSPTITDPAAPQDWCATCRRTHAKDGR